VTDTLNEKQNQALEDGIVVNVLSGDPIEGVQWEVVTGDPPRGLPEGEEVAS